MGMIWLHTSNTGKANLFSDYFSSDFVEDNNTLPDFSPDCIDRIENFTCDLTMIMMIKIVKKN